MITGAAILAVCRLQAQSFNYNSDDLVLNFRNTGNITANDLEVDAGPVSALANGTSTSVLLHGGAGGFLQQVYGGLPSGSLVIGFSAAAADSQAAGTGLIWLSRSEAGPGTLASGQTPPAQVAQSINNQVLNKINNIAAGAQSGTILASEVSTVPGGTSGNNYQAQGEQNTTLAGQQTINYGGQLSVLNNKGGPIESTQNGSGDVYEGLWEQPPSGAGSDQYLGYFTFQPNGEVDFTPAGVPEPSTYALLAGSGICAWIFRRRIAAFGLKFAQQ